MLNRSFKLKIKLFVKIGVFKFSRVRLRGFSPGVLKQHDKFLSIGLRSNKVKKLNKNAFNEAKTIDNFDLIDNEIEAIEHDTFSMMPNLREINLERNSIRRIGNRKS